MVLSDTWASTSDPQTGTHSTGVSRSCRGSSGVSTNPRVRQPGHGRPRAPRAGAGRRGESRGRNTRLRDTPWEGPCRCSESLIDKRIQFVFSPPYPNPPPGVPRDLPGPPTSDVSLPVPPTDDRRSLREVCSRDDWKGTGGERWEWTRGRPEGWAGGGCTQIPPVIPDRGRNRTCPSPTRLPPPHPHPLHSCPALGPPGVK